MVKIGVLIIPNSLMERGTIKNKFMEGKKYFGLRKILKEMDLKYEFCSPENINKYDYVIYSLISFFDVLNLVKVIPIKRKCKIIVGGGGCNNIRGILPWIDIANFGRCDKGKLRRIIDGENSKTVWRKENDESFSNKYEVDISDIDGLGYEGEIENSVGCSKKCYFCFYSWWNGYIHNKEDGYKSGFSHQEDFFNHLNWNNSKGTIITGLDGFYEKTRKYINKNITCDEIENKLLELNNYPDKHYGLKIYNVCGLPDEKKEDLYNCDLVRIANKIEKKMKNKIKIHFHLSHFVPMQKTPLWNFSFNWTNYRKAAREKPILYQGNNIIIYSGAYATSPSIAAIHTIIQRADNEDYIDIKKLTNKKFHLLSVRKKIKILRNQFEKYFVEQNKEMIYNIKTCWNYRKIKEVL